MPDAPDQLLNSANLAISVLMWAAVAEATAIVALFGSLMLVLKNANNTLNQLTAAVKKLVSEADRKNNLEQIRQELTKGDMSSTMLLEWQFWKKRKPNELDELLERVDEVLSESDDTCMTISNDLLNDPETPENLRGAITKLAERISDRE